MPTKDELLREIFGYTTFRPGQEPLIEALLSGRDVVGIMPTGAGKSVCYQLPALLAPGITLVISPLISLMQDQVAALKQVGVPAAYLNSTLTQAQITKALANAVNGMYKLIYVAPERLDTPDFRTFALSTPIALVAVDEAHCVSQWGQDFRPSYLSIRNFIASLPQRPPVGAFTATATQRVSQDIVSLLGLVNPHALTTGFDRPNLVFSVHRPKDKFAALMAFLADHPRESGIVYCLTRKAVEEVCANLGQAGIAATRYHAGLTEQERRENQLRFQRDEAPVMVATNAFGMGIDKSNVAFVVHYHMPKDMESYYQEAGRAGRDGSPAHCALLFAPQDIITNKFLINRGRENSVLEGMESQKALSLALGRLQAMIGYCTQTTCLRAGILSYFGQKAASACGNCGVCLAMPDWGAKPAPVPKARPSLPQLQEPGDQLFTQLKALRQQLAQRQGVPAYVIFPDATLRAMVDRQPDTLEALLELPGVGQLKAQRYGPAFLALLTGGRAPAPRSQGPKAGKEGRNLPATHAYQGWSEAQDMALQEAFEREVPVKTLAQEMGRTRGAIRARLKRLGLWGL